MLNYWFCVVEALALAPAPLSEIVCGVVDRSVVSENVDFFVPAEVLKVKVIAQLALAASELPQVVV